MPAVGTDVEGNGEVFRLNLELGRFMKSYAVDVGSDDNITDRAGGPLQGGINAGAVNVAANAQGDQFLSWFSASSRP